MRNAIIKTAVAAALALPLLANAESQFNTAAGPSSAVAKVDFQITIPRVLFLQVGILRGMDLAHFRLRSAEVKRGSSAMLWACD